MEPAATSFLVARDPPSPKTAHLGQVPAQPGWARGLFLRTLCFLLANGLAWGLCLYRAGDDLGFAVSTTYLLMALCCCLWKLELLRRDPASAAQERRRFGLVACAVSLALVSTVTVHVARLAPSLALKVALWMLGSVAASLALYFMFVAIGGGARTEDAGRCQEKKDLHELSPEQRV